MHANSFEESPPEPSMDVLVVTSETALSEIVKRTQRLGSCRHANQELYKTL